MTQDTQNREDEFFNRIHCNFPYKDIVQSEKLIEEALSISDYAVFKVIEELARVPYPKESNASTTDLKYFLSIISSKFEHPLFDEIKSVAELMIEDKEITVNEALNLMNKIEGYKGLSGALSLVYFSADDVDGILDQRHYEICAKWNKIEP